MPAGAGCKVRAAVAGDLPAILALYDQLAGDRPEGRAIGGSEGAAIFEAMRDQPGRSVVVAETDGRVVGTADLVVVANLTHRGRPWAMLENVVVDEGRRGEGVGRALLDEVAALAERQGCYKIQLLSRSERTAAHRFYEAMGFGRMAVGFRRYLD